MQLRQFILLAVTCLLLCTGAALAQSSTATRKGVAIATILKKALV